MRDSATSRETGAVQAAPLRQREAAVAQARSIFLRCERVEVNELAEFVGVNRNTVFRWFGGRDRILGEVVWSISEPALVRSAESAEGQGAVRIANVMGNFALAANQGTAFMSFVRREPQRALRVMTTQAGGVHQRILDWIVALIDEEVAAGRYRPELPVHDLAYLLLRTAEAFVYSPVITGEEPDSEKVRLASAALLGVASKFVVHPAQTSALPESPAPDPALPVSLVRCTLVDGVADVQLSRPERLNALDEAMFEAIIEVGRELAGDRSVRAVVLSGAGQAFCSGLDGDQPGPGDLEEQAQLAAHVWEALPAPVIAAVHGVAFGSGLQLALGADLRIVEPGAQLSLRETNGGIVPSSAGTQMLDGLVRQDIANDLIYTGRIVDGAEAVGLGLATRTAEDPYAAAMEYARQVASAQSAALGG